MTTTTTGRGWWVATWLIWAVLPTALSLIIALVKPDALIGIGFAEWYGYLGYLWVLIGVIAAIVSGTTGGGRLFSAIIVIVAALAPLLIYSFTNLPALLYDAGRTPLVGGILVAVVIGIISPVGIAVAQLVAGRAAARILWIILIAAVLIAGQVVALVYVQQPWAGIVFPLVASLLIALVALALGRKR